MGYTLPLFKNIIFDLGGVIMNLDPQATINRFKEAGVKNIETLYSSLHHDNFIIEFEKGEITPVMFRKKMRDFARIKLSDDTIDMAWSAMLQDIPAKRIGLLRKLKNNYRLFLLSNTNAIHIECFTNYVKSAYGINGLEEIFEKCYYSSDIGYRKPDIRAFQYVLDDAKINPQETLFIDDYEKNTEAAKKLGINEVLIKFADDIFTLFNGFF